MRSDQPPAEVTGGRRRLDIRIHAEGEVDAALRAELGALRVSRVPDGSVLEGTVIDTAELWGLLHRLRRAGLRLRSVDRIPGPETPREQSTPAERHYGDGLTARVEVDGYAAALVSMVVGTADVYQTPPSTTLVFKLGDDDTLFDVLAAIEDLALNLRGIHVDG